MKLGLTTLMLSAVLFSRVSFAESFWNQPQVLRGAQTLAVEVEHLDEALHNVKAPAHVIQKVHHFEETVNDFVLDLQKGCTYEFALAEFAHIREDVGIIRDELYAHPGLLNNHQVWTEWNAMRRAYRYLDHALYAHSRRHLDADHSESKKVDQEMNKLIEELEAHQASK